MSSFTNIILPQSSRPAPFSSQKTADRLEDCARRRASTTSPKPRKSIFKELGLDDLSAGNFHPGQKEMQATEDAKELNLQADNIAIARVTSTTEKTKGKQIDDTARWGWIRRTPGSATGSASTLTLSTITRFAMLTLLIAVAVPGLLYSTRDGHAPAIGADAGVIWKAELVDNASTIEGRELSPTDTCTRWSHMAANVNGTLYIYGGEAKTASGQDTNTWNNDFLIMDLTKTWNIASPSMSGLPQPSGPPAVAEGYLWHTHNSLFLYGGEFSDTPATSPSPVATWEYDISSSTWIEHSSPQTSAGNNSDTAPAAVQRAAEGAGLSVPELGRSWYFGGHLDLFTTPGWSNQIARVYLKGLLEFTHPGFANNGIDSLGANGAEDGGVYRNITQGGLQADAGFTERADGLLVYVPGWGNDGILLGLAGGTNTTFTEMNVIDVYDIASSTWYKQSTSGTSPSIRVNPCAVVAAAPDGSSFNVYLYGGQNLIPFGEQIQYSDMWILTIPAFTWIKVDLSGQSEPPARAGHTCTIWDGQIVVVGGYVGTEISCDSPGIYVFNASSLQWISEFTALTSSSAADSSSEVIKGSIGYSVPDAVQSVIGGSALGGATATSPIISATGGPLATGHPPTFTVTKSGSTIVQTSLPTSSTVTVASDAKPDNSSLNIGAIVAGIIAALLAILATYLAFCSWLYRRQLKLYRDHVAMAQRASFNSSPGEKLVSHTNPFKTNSSESSRTPESGDSIAMTSSRTSDSRDYAYGARDTSLIYGAGTLPWRLSEEGSELGDEGGYLARPSNVASTAHSSAEDLLRGREMGFWSVVLSPRRTLRIVNADE